MSKMFGLFKFNFLNKRLKPGLSTITHSLNSITNLVCVKIVFFNAYHTQLLCFALKKMTPVYSYARGAVSTITLSVYMSVEWANRQQRIIKLKELLFSDY